MSEFRINFPPMTGSRLYGSVSGENDVEFEGGQEDLPRIMKDNDVIHLWYGTNIGAGTENFALHNGWDGTYKVNQDPAIFDGDEYPGKVSRAIEGRFVHKDGYHYLVGSKGQFIDKTDDGTERKIAEVWGRSKDELAMPVRYVTIQKVKDGKYEVITKNAITNKIIRGCRYPLNNENFDRGAEIYDKVQGKFVKAINKEKGSASLKQLLQQGAKVVV